MPKRASPLPPVSMLRELFRYEPETGFLFNRISRTSRKAGARAEHPGPGGYFQVYADRRLLYAHRVIWTIFHGEEPAGFIDHIDGNKRNNCISNLRVTTHAMNMCNRSAASHSASGAKGVYRRKDNGMWRAYIVVNGKRKSLGQFPSFEEADDAAISARRKFHGDFARD